MLTLTDISGAVDQRLAAIENKLIAWRRDFHQNPNSATAKRGHRRSSRRISKRLGLKVKTGVAHTGVVALLEGSRPGPVVGCAPTWTRCRSPSRSICRSSRTPAPPTTAKRSA